MSNAQTFELVDTHIHFWDLGAHRWYPAMQEPDPDATFESLGDVTRMARDFLLPEFNAELGGYDLLGLVHVSAVSAPRVYVEETAWVDRLIAEADLPGAIVGAVDPDLSREELAEHIAAQAKFERLRGIRVLAGIDPETGFATDLCELLGEHGLLLDLVAHPGEAAGLGRLIERFPDLPIVLEHAGWPDGTGEAEVAAWREAIAEFARHPNLTCKVSGLGMVTHTLEEAALRPWVEHCLEAFGPERCFFGGNFPVDAMYGTYGELVESIRAATSSLSAEQQAAFFVGNGRRVYGL